MTLTINVSEELYRRATEIAAEENVSVEELFAAAFQEWIVEFERLKERAARGSCEKFRQVMSEVHPAEPGRVWPSMIGSDRARLRWRRTVRACGTPSPSCFYESLESANKLLTEDPKTARSNQHVRAASY